MLRPYIKKLIQGNSLTTAESYAAGQLLATDGMVNHIQIAAFLTTLAAKGETVDELLGLFKAIKEKAVPLNIDHPTLDIVGTGGDNANTINISTASALLTAACGVPVVKHGGRAVSSSCGSVDVLEILGYKVDLAPQDLAAEVLARNFAFCNFANYNPGLARVREVRRDLKLPTVINLLGPLLNPAGTKHMLIGVYSPKIVPLMAETLLKIGTVRSIIFHGNGLDELSCLGKIEATLVTGTKLENIVIDPQELGLAKCTLNDLQGDDALYNAGYLKTLLSGEPTLATDTIILNAGVALFIYGKAATIAEGIKIAKERLAEGNILKPNRLLEIMLRKKLITYKRKSLKSAILTNKGHAVIAEIKRASPSAGKIASISDPVKRALEYVNCGATAISVLTDEGFEGSLDDLAKVSQALRETNAPVLCKDFIIYPEQIAQAAQAGADAVLIMVSVLHGRTKEMVAIAHGFGLETLVEVHSEYELPIALASGGDLIGVNQRDLTDFTMHPEIYAKLVGQIPNTIVKVAESGVKTYHDAKNSYNSGYDAVLVGEALSRMDNPQQFFVELGA